MLKFPLPSLITKLFTYDALWIPQENAKHAKALWLLAAAQTAHPGKLQPSAHQEPGMLLLQHTALPAAGQFMSWSVEEIANITTKEKLS